MVLISDDEYNQLKELEYLEKTGTLDTVMDRMKNLNEDDFVHLQKWISGEYQLIEGFTSFIKTGDKYKLKYKVYLNVNNKDEIIKRNAPWKNETVKSFV